MYNKMVVTSIVFLISVPLHGSQVAKVQLLSPQQRYDMQVQAFCDFTNAMENIKRGSCEDPAAAEGNARRKEVNAARRRKALQPIPLILKEYPVDLAIKDLQDAKERGANINVLFNGESALMIAVSKEEYLPIVQALIAMGVALDEKGLGHTALALAACKRNKGAVKALLHAGADITAKNSTRKDVSSFKDFLELTEAQVVGRSEIMGKAMLRVKEFCIAAYQEVQAEKKAAAAAKLAEDNEAPAKRARVSTPEEK